MTSGWRSDKQHRTAYCNICRGQHKRQDCHVGTVALSTCPLCDQQELVRWDHTRWYCMTCDRIVAK